MDDAVLEFCQLRTVPSVCRADKIAGDSLEPVDSVAVALRAFFKVLVGILEAAVHAAVPVVVHGAVSHVVFVHEVHYCHDCLRIVGCVSVNFHIEDVAASCQAVVWSLDFSLVLRRAVVIYRDMVGIGVVFLVGDSRNDSEFLPVCLGEPAGEAFCRGGKHTEVMLESL